MQNNFYRVFVLAFGLATGFFVCNHEVLAHDAVAIVATAPTAISSPKSDVDRPLELLAAGFGVMVFLARKNVR